MRLLIAVDMECATGAVRLNGGTIEFQAPDMPQAHQMFRAAVSIAAV
jgi:D-aminopeptidase